MKAMPIFLNIDLAASLRHAEQCEKREKNWGQSQKKSNKTSKRINKSTVTFKEECSLGRVFILTRLGLLREDHLSSTRGPVSSVAPPATTSYDLRVKQEDDTFEVKQEDDTFEYDAITFHDEFLKASIDSIISNPSYCLLDD